MAMTSRPLAVYRHFVRSIRTAFKKDDLMQQSALAEVRSKFKASAAVTDPAEVDKLCAEGMDAANFLTTYVVQAELNERGNYEMKVEPQHTDTVAEEAALRPNKPSSV